MQTQTRIWIDGIFDLAHAGHFNLFRLAQLSGGAEVVVGIHGDRETAKYTKHPPILSLKERERVVQGCRWVKQTVSDVPFVTQVKTLDEHKCGICVHGPFTEDTYSEVREASRCLMIQQNSLIETSDYIGRMLLMTTKHHLDWRKVHWEADDLLAAIAASAGPEICVYNEDTKTVRKVFSFSPLLANSERSCKNRVYVDGSFDLLHAGHVSFLEEASNFSKQSKGGGVVVGLYGDSEVNEIKGDYHPVQNVRERLLAIASCSAVECILIGAPAVVTESILEQIGASHIVYGASGLPSEIENENESDSEKEGADSKDSKPKFDPYSELRHLDKVSVLPAHEFGYLTTKGILGRIIRRHLGDVIRGTAMEQHGGQQWREMGSSFVDDFSLTCNSLGIPPLAMDTMKNSLDLVAHYPPDNQQPAMGAIARFLRPELDADNDMRATAFEGRLLLGNGASELIDLIVRTAPSGSFARPAFDAQFMEYERSAKSMGRRVLDPKGNLSKESFGIAAIVNPCNPTGDFMQREELLEYIEEFTANSSPCNVIVDESMLFWYGKDWRKQSLSQPEIDGWITKMQDERGVSVYVIASWTKIWTCPGLRIGSVLTPKPADAIQLKKIMVPWSVNFLAIEFVAAAIKDTEYMEQTWENTKKWRAEFIGKLMEIHPTWKVKGEEWLSWMWIDTLSAESAASASARCLEAGCPVREGRIGYALPTCFRVSVRKPELHDAVIEALKKV